MVIKAFKNQALIADKCHVAESFLDRLKGLIGRKTFEPGEGLLLPRCNDVHMWFMSVPIDILFIRSERRPDGRMAHVVASLRERVRPWKLLPVRDWTAEDTLEVPAGTVSRIGLKPGDELSCTS